MSNFIDGKSIIVTGAANGFGRLISLKASRLGAKVTCADINEQGLTDAVSEINAQQGVAQAFSANVTNLAEMQALAAKTVEAYGAIDVIINNAGTMPLAFFADHQAAINGWNKCIDVNFKGVLNGIISVHDQMIVQGYGHVINISSIYGNFPVAGAGVYGATKAAVNFLSEALRVESKGKIKVTTIKPTGVPATGLLGSVINTEGIIGILGQNAADYVPILEGLGSGEVNPKYVDPASMEYTVLDPEFIADQVLHAINQPAGVSLGDITVRASGDHFIL